MTNTIRCRLVFSFAAMAFAALAQPADSSVIAQIRNHRGGIALWWAGNNGWLIKSGDLLIGTDLDLESRNRLGPPPVSSAELAEVLDVAFVTHHHGDHFNIPTLRVLARQGRCTFVLPKTCLKRASEIGIPADRIVVPEPLHPFEVKGVRVEPLHAIHGNQEFTVLTREPEFVEAIASNCGYVFNLEGKRIFQPGDSVLTEEHLALKNIDVLFVSPTVHNMYVDRSAILINRLEPAYIFPQHFETYEQVEGSLHWTRGYPDELRLRLSNTLQKRYHKLKQGEMFVVR